MECIISLWWKKKRFVDIFHSRWCCISTQLACFVSSCALSRCRCVCLSVPSCLSAFSACSLAVIFALPNYSPGNEGGLTELNLAVCQWLMACLLPGWSSVTVRKPVDLRSCLSVCLPRPVLPCPAPLSPAHPPCMTVKLSAALLPTAAQWLLISSWQCFHPLAAVGPHVHIVLSTHSLSVHLLSSLIDELTPTRIKWISLCFLFLNHRATARLGSDSSAGRTSIAEW